MEYEQILENLKTLQKDRFKTAINRLLNDCFIVNKCPETRTDYQYIRSNKEAFSGILELLGYDLIIQEDIGVISIYNNTGTGRMHFSKLETILLLIFRLLYIEKKQTLSQINDVIVIMDEVYDKYNLLNLKRPSTIQIQNSIGKFRRMHLINPLDRVLAKNTGLRIEVYPSITLGMTSFTLEQIYILANDKLESFADNGEGDTDYADEYDNEEESDEC